MGNSTKESEISVTHVHKNTDGRVFIRPDDKILGLFASDQLSLVYRAGNGARWSPDEKVFYVYESELIPQEKQISLICEAVKSELGIALTGATEIPSE